VLLLFFFWLGWNLLQIIPLPMGLLEGISPLSAEMYRLVTPDIASAPISVDVNATREMLITSLAYVLIFALVLLLVDNMKRLRVFVLWLIVIGVLQAVFASLALFGSQEIYYGSSSAQGTFANRNQLAGFLELNLAIGIGLLLSSMSEQGSRSWRERIRGWAQSLLSRKVRIRIYLAIMVITLVLTHSRMGNTAFFSSMTIAGVLAVFDEAVAAAGGGPVNQSGGYRHLYRQPVVWTGAAETAFCKYEERGGVTGYSCKYLESF